MTAAQDRFFGKYRGKVELTLDPLGQGRIQVSVPDVMGDGTMAWAMPCLPGAGPGVGLFVIPPRGANVWVEFERGDPDYPVWSGGFWGIGEAPAPLGPTQAMTRIWKGDTFALEVLDVPGLATLTLSVTTATGAAVITAGMGKMEVSFAGASIALGPDGVTVNNGNLKVLP